MERGVTLAEGEFYHLYNRGVEKRNIFLDEHDKKRFMRLLYLANSHKSFTFRLVQGLPLNEIDIGKPCIAIGAYVLMPNHFHILAKEIEPGGISAFMEKLQTGYSMYFNKKNERVGSLFQGRFKAEHISRDEHLKYLFAYIHLNPVKFIDPEWKERTVEKSEEVRAFLQAYPYSSHLEYGQKVRTEESLILSKEEFPEYFSKPKDYERFINDWLQFKGSP